MAVWLIALEWLLQKMQRPIEIVDPRPFAVGSIHDTFSKYTHLEMFFQRWAMGKNRL